MVLSAPFAVSRTWTSRLMRTAPWTSVWKSRLNERAVCQAPAQEFVPQTLRPPRPHSIIVEAAGWHRQICTPTNRRSGRDPWTTPNPIARGRRKLMRSVQLENHEYEHKTLIISCDMNHREKYWNINNRLSNSKAFWKKNLLSLVYFCLIPLSCFVLFHLVIFLLFI